MSRAALSPQRGKPPAARAPREPTLRWLGVILGGLPGSLCLAVALARDLPGSGDLRLASALTLAIPLWVAVICFLSLVRHASRVWAISVGLALLFGALAYRAPSPWSGPTFEDSP